MTKKHVPSAKEELEQAARDTKTKHYVLRLYVAGMTPRSEEAIRKVTAVCENQLAGRCSLEVIDIFQHPALAKGEQIIAVPTLVKRLPLPLRKIIGSLANEEKLFLGLDLRPEDLSR